jgi:hypothetical protein
MMMPQKQERDRLKKRKVAPEMTISAQITLQKWLRGWYGNVKNKYKVDSLTRLKLTHREDYNFCEAMPKGLNGALHTAPKAQVIYSACTACSGMTFFLHPEDPSQNFAVLDDQSKAIAQRHGFLEVEFTVLAKGGLLPQLNASTRKKSDGIAKLQYRCSPRPIRWSKRNNRMCYCLGNRRKSHGRSERQNLLANQAVKSHLARQVWSKGLQGLE